MAFERRPTDTVGDVRLRLQGLLDEAIPLDSPIAAPLDPLVLRDLLEGLIECSLAARPCRCPH